MCIYKLICCGLVWFLFGRAVVWIGLFVFAYVVCHLVNQMGAVVSYVSRLIQIESIIIKNYLASVGLRIWSKKWSSCLSI